MAFCKHLFTSDTLFTSDVQLESKSIFCHGEAIPEERKDSKKKMESIKKYIQEEEKKKVRLGDGGVLKMTFIHSYAILSSCGLTSFPCQWIMPFQMAV